MLVETARVSPAWQPTAPQVSAATRKSPGFTNFTNSADFDDTLPVADGQIEASFRLTPEKFAEGLAAWLTQRGKGEGQPAKVEARLAAAVRPSAGTP